jgi:hypothetical protein
MSLSVSQNIDKKAHTTVHELAKNAVKILRGLKGMNLSSVALLQVQFTTSEESMTENHFLSWKAGFTIRQ